MSIIFYRTVHPHKSIYVFTVDATWIIYLRDFLILSWRIELSSVWTFLKCMITFYMFVASRSYWNTFNFKTFIDFREIITSDCHKKMFFIVDVSFERFNDINKIYIFIIVSCNVCLCHRRCFWIEFQFNKSFLFLSQP